MIARMVKAKITSKRWLTPTVLELLFEPEKKFNYQSGQFLSLMIPSPQDPKLVAKRMYSFASPVELAKKEGYRLCVKYVPGGIGSEYIKSLNISDSIRLFGPYGNFVFTPTSKPRSICLIATGSGISPMRAILLSRELLECAPRRVTFIFGARSESEILYPELAQLPFAYVIPTLTAGSSNWTGFRGRVTDYLKQLPKDWAWHQTDFYLCGNPQMIEDVLTYLSKERGVDLDCIFHEAFGAPVKALPLIKKAA
jgi:p-cymene monooxygenase electron transfer component